MFQEGDRKTSIIPTFNTALGFIFSVPFIAWPHICVFLFHSCRAYAVLFFSFVHYIVKSIHVS